MAEEQVENQAEIKPNSESEDKKEEKAGKKVPKDNPFVTEEDVFDAFTSVNPSDLEDLFENYLVASGFVKGHWSGKSFKATSVHAIGPVDLEGGGEAILVAVGHEIYE